MIKKRKLPKQPYYKLYDDEFPYIQIIIHESQLEYYLKETSIYKRSSSGR